MIVDLETLFRRQGPPSDRQIVDLAEIVHMLRHVQPETELHIFRTVVAFPVDNVLFLVDKQIFLDRQILSRHPGLALFFLMTETKPVIKCTRPLHRRDFLHPVDLLRRHEFAADIGLRNEGKIVIQFCPAFFKFGLQFSFRTYAFSDLLVILNDGIAFEHFKPHPHFMDTVINSLKLGRFVDDIFRRRDLSTIVQPGPDMQFVAFILVHREIREPGIIRLRRRFRQHHRQFRHPLTMPARIG